MTPIELQGAGLASLRPAATDEASGASASTCSWVHVGTRASVAVGPDTSGASAPVARGERTRFARLPDGRPGAALQSPVATGRDGSLDHCDQDPG
ncbi:hypothetical protein CTKZ_03390 [Cellulomonas algicola]|uniref:Uncharacterized protein n=1 Tax=Cellulomonas algicola TaxID=2071633 RepID=A0A401UVR9_9CELL|nr:hypothetical protein CTKZ_03390 [Cellulomonas algicola]